MDKAHIGTQVNFANVGEAISHELAAKMVKDFHDANLEGVSKSFIIGKNIIDQILAQPGCVALNIFNGIDEDGRNTLVYAGIDKNGHTILDYPGVNEKGQLGRVEALIGDRTIGPGPSYIWFS